MSIFVYESFEGLTGKKSSYDGLIDELSSFARHSVLWHCAALSFGARVWESNRRGEKAFDQQMQLALVRYFPRPLAERLYAGFFCLKPRIVFHRKQILALEKLAILHCHASGTDIDSMPYAFGRMLLKINDHLNPLEVVRREELRSEHDFADLIALFLPISEMGSENLGATLTRTYWMLDPLTQGRAQSNRHVDALRHFEMSTGLQFSAFSAFLFASQAWLNSKTYEGLLKEPGELYLNHHRFSQTALTAGELTKLFQLVSKSAIAISHSIKEKDFGVSDDTGLRKTPAIERWMNIGLTTQWCGYLVLDPIYLWERLITEPYWLASEHFGQSFRSFWGDLFEDYCNQLMGEATRDSNLLYLPDVRDPNQRQVSDALLLEGETLILLEYKACMLSAEAKYSGDAALLREAIYRNFVRTESGQKKGVEQLASSLNRMFGPERLVESKVPRWKEIKRVLPCIVTLDSIGGGAGVSSLLRLYSNFDSVPVDVSPVFCLSVSELERRAPYFKSTGFASMLEQWLLINPPLGTPLSQMDIPMGEKTELPILNIQEVLEGDISYLRMSESS